MTIASPLTTTDHASITAAYAAEQSRSRTALTPCGFCKGAAGRIECPTCCGGGYVDEAVRTTELTAALGYVSAMADRAAV